MDGFLLAVQVVWVRFPPSAKQVLLRRIFSLALGTRWLVEMEPGKTQLHYLVSQCIIRLMIIIPAMPSVGET